MSAVDHAGRVEAVERELDTLVGAVLAGPADDPVPSCPAWTVTELADHVGLFCRFWAEVLIDGERPARRAFATAGEASDPIGDLGDHADRLVQLLRGSDPATARWTWMPDDQTVGFIARRCAHETAVHRVDAQLARGPHDPIDADMAVDGIEEIFAILDHPARRPAGGAGETLHLHGTDHDAAEWLVTLRPEGIGVEREHAKGDLAIRAGASDLELLLYQRPTLGEVQTFGDPAVLTTFHRGFTF